MIVFVFQEMGGGFGDRIIGLLTSLLLALRLRAKWQVVDTCGHLVEAFDVYREVLYTGKHPHSHDVHTIHNARDAARVAAIHRDDACTFVTSHVAIWVRRKLDDVSESEMQRVVALAKNWIFAWPSYAVQMSFGSSGLFSVASPRVSFQVRFGDHVLMSGSRSGAVPSGAIAELIDSFKTRSPHVEETFVTSDSCELQEAAAAAGFQVLCRKPMHTTAHAHLGHVATPAERIAVVADLVQLWRTWEVLHCGLNSNFGFAAVLLCHPECHVPAFPTMRARLLEAGKGPTGDFVDDPLPAHRDGMWPWLHLGCGTKYIPHWVNIDAEAHSNAQPPDIIDDVRTLASIKDDSAQRIYACHVLEHMDRAAVPDVLATWFRKLAVGGTLRLAVPDFAAVAAYYSRTGDIAAVTGLVCGGQTAPWNYHRVIFDAASLTAALEAAGFVDVRPWDWRCTDHAHVDDYSQAYLPHMRKSSGLLMSLNLEADKPAPAPTN